MPPKAPAIDNETYLSSSQDWQGWFNRLERTARRKDVWEYFDPDQLDGPTLTKPILPTVDEYLRELNDIAKRDFDEQHNSWEERGRQGREPAQPAEIHVLSTSHIKTLEQRREEHKFRLADYKLNHDVVMGICEGFDRTVDASWMDLTKEAQTPREVVQALRRNVSQTEQETADQASVTYNKVMTAVSRTVDPQEWYKRWEKARMDGERYKIPEVQGRNAISSFLQVSEKMYPTLATTHRVNFQASSNYRIDDQLVTLKVIGDLFIKFAQSESTRDRKRKAAVFGLQQNPDARNGPSSSTQPPTHTSSMTKASSTRGCRRTPTITSLREPRS